MDLWDVDVRRMMPFQRNRSYLHDRTVEALGLLYAMHWPYRQPETARGVRRSPVHDRLAARGACFGETAGWERANWFAPDGVPPVRVQLRTPELVRPLRRRASRRSLGIVVRPVVVRQVPLRRTRRRRVLNKICANDVAVPVGKIVYTQWLNDNGGIEADLTVTAKRPIDI
jgi:4-methylaminobutanoate oxidase (formaldehyde-forming)